MASPRPYPASMTICLAPLLGSTVNMIPENSELTILWTTTASLTSLWEYPCFSRYAMARAVKSDDQHFLILSYRSSSSFTLR